MIKININWKIPLDGTIIDFESTHYDAKKGELVTAGFLSNDGFTIIQRVKTGDADFRNQINKEITALERPLYAFNKKCEEGFCNIAFDSDLQFENMASYVVLRNEGLLELYNSLCDPIFGEEVPMFWEAWKITQNPLFLCKIVRHNYCCLAKEYYIKIKTVDKLKHDLIKPFLSSAPIEKKYIRPSLGFVCR